MLDSLLRIHRPGVTREHCTRAHDAPTPDADPGLITTLPPIQQSLPTQIGLPELEAVAAFNCRHWMGGAVDLDVRTERDVRSDIHGADLEHHAVGIEERVLSHGEAAPIVAMKGRFDPKSSNAHSGTAGCAIGCIPPCLRTRGC